MHGTKNTRNRTEPTPQRMTSSPWIPLAFLGFLLITCMYQMITSKSVVPAESDVVYYMNNSLPEQYYDKLQQQSKHVSPLFLSCRAI